MNHRVEKDSLGEVRVPDDAYWGAVTQRSVENFQISGLKMPRAFIKALGIVKLACAKANMELGVLDEKIAEAVISAAAEVIEGKLDSEFPVDVFQTGSGTHSNMNANEVIANRACEMFGKKRGSGFIHPNDHVNLSQSSNDVIPTAIHVSAVESINESLLPSLEKLRKELASKSVEFKGVLKSGRTHLMDATPVTLGMEFATYQRQIKNAVHQIKNAYLRLLELPVGGTAVGTGLNAPEGFASRAVKHISEHTQINFKENPFKGEGISSHDAVVELSGALKTLAVSLTKIANDIRWMASGPGAGLGEISVPGNEPGSSIMPGKINPTQAEALLMVCAQVMGNDLAITVAGSSGNFELNVMKPLIAYDTLQSISILSRSVDSFSQKCVRGISPNKDRIKELLERNLMVVTALTPHIGYDRAAEIAKKALKSGKSIREVALEEKVLPAEVLDRLLDPAGMT